MRITGGQAKGRHLTALKGLKIRPSSDLVRESIFNLIGQDLTGLTVLDLFAGTGSLGIEALSRGASSAVFIDNSWQSIRILKKNLILCGYATLGFVIKKDMKHGLPWKHPLLKKNFDLVFLDPPYKNKLLLPLLQELSDKEILSSSAMVVAEYSKFDQLPSQFGKLQLVTIKTYGETKISHYSFKEDP